MIILNEQIISKKELWFASKLTRLHFPPCPASFHSMSGTTRWVFNAHLRQCCFAILENQFIFLTSPFRLSSFLFVVYFVVLFRPTSISTHFMMNFAVLSVAYLILIVAFVVNQCIFSNVILSPLSNINLLRYCQLAILRW